MNLSFRVTSLMNRLCQGSFLLKRWLNAEDYWYLSTVEEPEKYSTYFLKIDKLKFKHKVVPGDTVILKMDLIEPMRRGIVMMFGQAFVGNHIVAEGEMTAQVVKNK